MSTYVSSDLHGYPLEKFKMMLGRAEFSTDDTLYILGDVIDRNGDGGVEILRFIMDKPNVKLILGNHEDMLLACSFLFADNYDPCEDIGPIKAAALDRYKYNGGDVTLRTLKMLNAADPNAVKDIFTYLFIAPLYLKVNCSGRQYLLVHSGIGHFSPNKRLTNYFPFDFLWERPTLETEYYDDTITVFGHTPTLYYGKEYYGKIIRTRTWINIDTGAARGLEPTLLRLDDEKSFTPVVTAFSERM